VVECRVRDLARHVDDLGDTGVGVVEGAGMVVTAVETTGSVWGS
jgi:hypothetical protein